jgi:protein KRI1
MAAIQAETDGLTAGRDDEKPTWDDDIDIGDIVPPQEDDVPHTTASRERKKEKKKEKKKRMKGDNDTGGVDVDEMDAEAPKEDSGKWDEVEWDGTEEMRKRVLDQYMSELYELEFNDMVRTTTVDSSPHTYYSRALIRNALRSRACPPASATPQ